MSDDKPVFVERRKGPDIIVKAVWLISGVNWLLAILGFAYADKARPQSETFFDRYLGKSARSNWDDDLLRYAFIILLINFVICIIGFLLNMLRQKRKTDKISKSIITIAVLSLFAILWYIFR